MKVKYFSDTDAAHIEFTDKNIHETKEISENIYIDVDGRGQNVSTAHTPDSCCVRLMNRR